MLKLKDNVDFSVLRDFGFRTGEEINEEDSIFYVDDYNTEDWFKFLRYDEDDEDSVGEIIYDANSNVAEVSMSFSPSNRKLFIEIAPISSYHVECHDLDVVTDTIFQLVKADIVEVV